jgi:EAL domain-containing protein (putative c-di-GMP-specific phosphodiesterase class I)/GGDEF domain-containing protein
LDEQHSTGILVVTADEDGLTSVSALVEDNGVAARCHWVADVESVPERLPEPLPRVILVLDHTELAAATRWRDEHLAAASVLLVADIVDEAVIEQALAAGAQDAVTVSSATRFTAVIRREIRLASMNSSLTDASEQVTEYRRQVEKLTTESSRAFLWAQEGIIADVNLAAVTLLGADDVTELVGMPVMDIFEQDSRAAIKGALVACQKGAWNDDALRCRVQAANDPKLPVEARLETDLFEDDTAVRIELSLARADAIPPEAQDDAEDKPATAGHPASIADPFVAFHHRRNFLHAITDALERPQSGGMRVLYHIRLDKMNALAERWGPLGMEEILRGIAETIADAVHPDDVWGQLAGGNFCVLADRGNHRDVEAWGEQMLKQVGELTFLLSGEDVHVRACIGAAILGRTDELGSLASKAARASRKAQEVPGSGVVLNDPRNASLEETADDRRNVKRIHSALRKDGFRLAYQPIADLEERSGEMYDVLLRMLDTGDKEILPGVFLPAAERNGLMKAIDRWVIARAVKSAAEQESTRLFVRVSRDSLPDRTLVEWLGQQLSRAKVSPERIVLQVTEVNATDNLGAAGDMAQAARKVGCGFALEHFGLGTEPRLLLETLPLDYIKIDGSLMQGFPTSSDLQKHVRDIVDEAKARDIIAIAERVEDANTMAALWSIGIEFIQGYYVQGHYVNGPEQIVLDGTGP